MLCALGQTLLFKSCASTRQKSNKYIQPKYIKLVRKEYSQHSQKAVTFVSSYCSLAPVDNVNNSVHN